MMFLAKVHNALHTPAVSAIPMTGLAAAPSVFGDIPIAGLTAPTLLGIFVLMMFTGKIWSNNAYQEKVKEAERWRSAYEAEREARIESDKQTTELLEVTKTTHAVITAMFHNSERFQLSGGTNVASE